MSDKPPSPFSSWRRWGVAGFLLFPIATAVGLFVGYFGGAPRGWAAGFLTGTLIALIRISSPLRAERWFWITVAVFAAADILGIELIDWSFTDDWDGHTFAGLAILDLGAMMAIVFGLYRLVCGRPAEIIQDDPTDLPGYAERNLDL